jgi:hypothetical protein
MRYIRSAILAAILTLALVVPATAGAQISSISLTVGPLIQRGAGVPVQVDVQCDPAWNLAFVFTSLTEAIGGHRVATGAGSFSPAFPGAPCAGPVALAVPMTVLASGPFAFRPGSAIAFTDVQVVNLTTGNLIDQTFTQTVQLPK